MKKNLVMIVACALMLLALNTPAMASYTCTGPVTFVGLGGSGVLTVSGMGGINAGYVCQVGASNNGWSSDACKALYSQLIVAEQTGAPFTFWFNDNLTCTTQPSWAWLTGLYFAGQQK